jgi:hypothetical protein
MVSKRNKIQMNRKTENIDLVDVNARVAIAFALTMILAILFYAVFLK